MVLLAHANLFIDHNMFNGLFIQGWSGVDFFFVLSGFIIFYTHYKDIGNRKNIISYMKKRIIRVYPIYWIYTILTLIFCIAIKIIFNKEIISWIDINFKNIIRCMLLYPTNVAKNEMPFLPIAHTLSFEIFFYFIFGLIIFFSKRISRIILSIWIICIVLNYLYIIPSFPIFGLLFKLMFSPNCFEFLIGCIIAFIYIKNNQRKLQKIFLLCFLIGIIWLSFSWINANGGYNILPDISHFIMFGIPYGLIIISTLFIIENKNIVKYKLLIFFGNASYSIYLIHYMVIILLIPYFKKINSYFSFFLISIISLIIGCLGYKIMEEPVLRILKRKIIKNSKNVAYNRERYLGVKGIALHSAASIKKLSGGEGN